MGLICFDLEGPLAPQDNAYELMKLFPGGDKIFEVVSRYDDLLTLEGRANYEPGDTLALIVPFLAHHGITEERIAIMGRESKLTPGAAELLAELRSRGWHIFCISTSYEQYALSVTQRLNIATENVACTRFPLEQIRRALTEDDFALVRRMEEEILSFNPFVDDDRIKEALDSFYYQELSRSKWGRVMSWVKPVGGKRKVDALQRFSARMGSPLSSWVVVGDSITDFKMLQTVNKAGGLAVAFNANEYALPYATMGLASTNLGDLWAVLQTWESQGRKGVEQMVRERQGAGRGGYGGDIHWLNGTKDIAGILETHKKMRRLIRGGAGNLG